MSSLGSRRLSHADRLLLAADEFITNKDKNSEETLGEKTVEDALFEMFEGANGRLSIGKFLSALQATGIKKSDPRLKELMRQLKTMSKEKWDGDRPENMHLERDEFIGIFRENMVLISKALRHHFVIPDFEEFTTTIKEIYDHCREIKTGNVANYIPQLSKFSPDYWGVSICTVDGQRFTMGDSDVPFTFQSSGKPICYAIALSELGSEKVHEYIGQEPSGRMFNELVLDYNSRPHNPMVNAGAILICSLLLKLVKPDMRVSEKFDWVCGYYKALAGGEFLSFNNATFLSEREAADRNYAIGFYMKEHKCYPEKSVLDEVMDFYFQMCSLEVNCQSVSVIAATLANGGICPITGTQVIQTHAVRDVLSLMHSCGMYDYSGQFAFKIGLPAKSGVSGCVMLVIPNVMGICCWSPPLDSYGNSVRGVEFCRKLVSEFNFHHFDNLRHSPHKKDPRMAKEETKGIKVVSLLFSAASGDVTAMRRYYLSGMQMDLSDYDGRTALHLAAAEGHLECVEFLLKRCKVDHSPTDRWGHTPLDDAIRFGHNHVSDFIQRWENTRPNMPKRISRPYIFSPIVEIKVDDLSN